MADVVEPQKTEEELEAEVAALMAGTKKKKKDKKEKKKDKGEKKDKKKKDKKKKKKGSDEDDDALPAGVDGESKADEGDAAAAAASGESNVYSSAAKETYQYQLLLTRVYEILKRNNPEYAVKKRYVMAPPQVYRVGSTRTCWANFATICGQMNRAPDHVLSFFLAELGNEGSIDGSQRLMLKGRFVPKKIESLLRKYIIEYVTCEMCHSPDTVLKRDPVSRLYFVNCKSCNASRAVSSIRAGFQALKRGQRRRERR
eukprot:INCI15251.1.p1 GENE.INCI15251.1~~INCI15251.1.p1  ORF type:complete len:257 (+),score=73.60 INCI15251.1:151-921(+)